MSMFNRNDKVNDTNTGTNAGTNPGMNTGETARLPEISPVPAAPAAKPAQPVAQPVSNIAAPRNIGVSVISKALKITGQLESTEDIRIDGEVEGDVRAVSVTVGKRCEGQGNGVWQRGRAVRNDRRQDRSGESRAHQHRPYDR